ncbi:hypothetical protein [Nodularia sp. UHCC 0506]|uniref:hypothetical protein n=1 Tax=Nodularia sp. UHCC 0506 TaxID=3110243 RepID=UPI002B20A574|nr:hypothetical protein [Nodularia sp. UHCC 0506]MEA5516193.1 hypothetical protein [Nodularia sp. UHCC 0506]
MSFKITKSNLLTELSPEKQELLAGGQNNFGSPDDFGSQNDFGGEDQFGRQDEFGSPQRRGGRDSEKRVRRIPIRLTGILEVVK